MLLVLGKMFLVFPLCHNIFAYFVSMSVVVNLADIQVVWQFDHQWVCSDSNGDICRVR